MQTNTQPTLAPSVAVYTSRFLSNEVQCAATLHVPSERPQPLPAILMVHGWGGVQSVLLDSFARCFYEAGYAVMTFDFPGWGESDGAPRNVINPWQRVKDVENALAHLKNQPQVDANRIVLWGTSFGGGHVIDVAAKHPELSGVIAHVPMLDGRDAVKAVPLTRSLRFGMYAATDLIKPGKPVYIPVIAPPGEFATMDRDNAYSMMLQKTNNDYDNRIAARSVLTMGFYRPIKRLRKIRIPTLVVGATRDSVAPFVESKINNKKAALHIKTLDADHFEPYVEPLLSRNLEFQLEFLNSIMTPVQTKNR